MHKFLNKVAGQPDSYEKKAKYIFGEIIGAGATGIVRKAKVASTNEEVAVKVILKKKVKGKEETIYSELELLRNLAHPHIVNFKESFESREKFYIVTQLCTGGELFDRICDVGRFTEKDAARSIYEVADAISYLHSINIIHRDIKPENLLYLTEKADSPLVICDFGIARTLQSGDDKVRNAAGSLGYAAPEIFGTAGHGKPCDIWSLGVVLYTLLSGYSPFQSDTITGFRKEVTPGFRVKFHASHWSNVSVEARTLVHKMIQYAPEDRPTIRKVLADKWFTLAGSDRDLLPSIKPGLSARTRWHMAFEKIRLKRRIEALAMDDDSDEEEGANSVASRFQEVVLAAQRAKELEKGQ